MPSSQHTIEESAPVMGHENDIVEQKACLPLKEERVFTGRSLQMTRFYFNGPDGKERVQEGIQRVRRNANISSVLGSRNLCTIGILKRQIMCDCLILVKQYRAPLKAYTLEFPARVIDSSSGHNLEDIISHEVEDDTGYTSTDIKHISPPTAVDPDVSDCKIRLVSLLIDGDDPLNHPTAKNDLDDESNGHGHIVELLQVPVNGLLDRLRQYSQQGLVIDSRVYAFAIGLKKGEKMALSQFVPNVENIY
ncbi:ADP-sugar pyrophosphatase-like protein [Dinothrombium tinctorium]|uniref:ADP-sugar pyrophosphatase-like protein n=1 Tax=Dinothrombium tinctorium TaxID=1965070 RepID=A0A3S3S2I2_9ACAR|nr:ADP-sugar pyrophosphatase-like protein [Dinothrombium tinctorium]RWS09715.1 ADP-sugar pyrophosphatase-like protein [Dinothrombium tinctorium]RWS11840.1 ADP-sugar pyrophosphatase-like protein [Dinothrombium tinctorium]